MVCYNFKSNQLQCNANPAPVLQSGGRRDLSNSSKAKVDRRIKRVDGIIKREPETRTQIESGTRESGDSSPHSSNISAAALSSCSCCCCCTPPFTLTSAARQGSLVLVHGSCALCSGADSSRHSWVVSAQHRCIRCTPVFLHSSRWDAGLFMFLSEWTECLNQNVFGVWWF